MRAAKIERYLSYLYTEYLYEMVIWILLFFSWQVAALYMCTRLIVNITQVYIPMYTLETLSLNKVLF